MYRKTTRLTITPVQPHPHHGARPHPLPPLSAALPPPSRVQVPRGVEHAGVQPREQAARTLPVSFLWSLGFRGWAFVGLAMSPPASPGGEPVGPSDDETGPLERGIDYVLLRREAVGLARRGEERGVGCLEGHWYLVVLVVLLFRALLLAPPILNHVFRILGVQVCDRPRSGGGGEIARRRRGRQRPDDVHPPALDEIQRLFGLKLGAPARDAPPQGLKGAADPAHRGDVHHQPFLPQILSVPSSSCLSSERLALSPLLLGGRARAGAVVGPSEPSHDVGLAVVVPRVAECEVHGVPRGLQLRLLVVRRVRGEVLRPALRYGVGVGVRGCGRPWLRGEGRLRGGEEGGVVWGEVFGFFFVVEVVWGVVRRVVVVGGRGGWCIFGCVCHCCSEGLVDYSVGGGFRRWRWLLEGLEQQLLWGYVALTQLSVPHGGRPTLAPTDVIGQLPKF